MHVFTCLKYLLDATNILNRYRQSAELELKIKARQELHYLFLCSEFQRLQFIITAFHLEFIIIQTHIILLINFIIY